jgi:hypothetical protein
MNISMTQLDIATILTESPRFREVAAKALASAEPLALDQLKGWVRGSFGSTSRIPAIKFVRLWAHDNNFPGLVGLADAKKFIDELIPYDPRA